MEKMMDPRILVLIATLCSPSGQKCEVNMTIDDSEKRPALNEISCNYSAALWIADWQTTHPGYTDWTVMKYGCVRMKPGEVPVLSWRF